MTAQPRIFQGYELLEEFQTGSMAESFRARDIQSGAVVFLKRVRLSVVRHRHALDREMAIYDRLWHGHNTHILQLLDMPRDDHYAGIVTEWADGGDLDCFVRLHGKGSGLPLAQVKCIAGELALALREMHSQNIVHRDLKPSNVLSVHGTIKLADFGIAKNNAKPITKKSFKRYGTRDYAAPEQLAGLEAHSSADIFSFGKILVYLLTGHADVARVTSPPWKAIILQCLHADPNVRPSVDSLLAELPNLPAG